MKRALLKLRIGPSVAATGLWSFKAQAEAGDHEHENIHSGDWNDGGAGVRDRERGDSADLERAERETVQMTDKENEPAREQDDRDLRPLGDAEKCNTGSGERLPEKAEQDTHN